MGKSIKYTVELKEDGQVVEAESLEIVDKTFRRPQGIISFIKSFTEALLGLHV